MEVLKHYITRRLSDVEEKSWAESAVVTIVWLITSDPAETSSMTAQECYLILQDIESTWKHKIRSEVSHGALVVRPSLTSVYTRANRTAIVEKDRGHLQRWHERCHGGLVPCGFT